MRISDWSSDVCSSDLQEFGDPHARKQGVEPAIESLRLGWSDRRHGLQLEPVAFERHAREPVRLELLGETAQPPVERPCPLLQIGGRIGLEWQAVGHLIEIGRASCRERVCKYV